MPALFNFKAILFCLFFINILNFLDRGIIPGASDEFNLFIAKSGIDGNSDVYLGLLQSAFIIGYALASIIFGHLVHFYSPFYLCTSGLIIWILAVISSGLAFYTDSYSYLFISRMVSGVGEAAFQISIPPWISKYAPPKHRGIYLSIFYTAIPTGTAIGYAYSAQIATTIGWQYAFFIEAILMSLFIPFLLTIAPMFPIEKPTSTHILHTNATVATHTTHTNKNNAYITPTKGPIRNIRTHDNNTVIIPSHHTTPTIKQELLVLFNSGVYVCTVLGYAAQTATMVSTTKYIHKY